MRLTFKAACAALRARSKRIGTGLVLATVVGLGACGGGNVAGDGTKPDHIVIEMTLGTTTSVTPASMFQCQLAQMRAIIVFTDGSQGDFTSRVVWSLGGSGAGAGQISNGDVPIDPTNLAVGNYAYGVLVPGNTGPVVVEADYQGLIGIFNLTVEPADPSTFSFVNGNNLINNSIDSTHALQSDSYKAPVTQAGTGTLWLGAGTNYEMKVVGPLNGVETDVTGYARWDFINGGDPGVVSISPLGVLTAGRAGATETLRAQFPGCLTQMTLPVAVADIQSLSIQQDPLFFDQTTQQYQSLLVGNFERIGIMADLGVDSEGNSIPQQDVSGAASLWVSDPNVLTVNQQVGGGAFLQAASAGTVTVQASESFANQVALYSPFVQVATTSGVLSGLAINNPSSDAYLGMPADCQLGSTVSPVLQSGSICTEPFTATGTYVLQDGSSVNQDVTYLATWTLNDNSFAGISSGVPLGGVVTTPNPSTAPAGQSIETVTVTIPGDQTIPTATSQFTLLGSR